MNAPQFIFIACMVWVAGCGRPASPPIASEEQPAPLLPQGTIVQAGEERGTVVYLYDDFRLDGKMGMPFCAIKHGVANPPGSEPLCPDTLYSDSVLTLLGDFRSLSYEGLYRRYVAKHRPEEFPANELYPGPLATPDFATDPNARGFRTVIREGCKEEGVNFGGHYTIIYWGCGAECDMMAMVDRISGRVYYTTIPFDTLDGHHGLSFHPTSYLLEVNTAATNQVEGYSIIYWRKPSTYFWNERKKRFELLQTME